MYDNTPKFTNVYFNRVHQMAKPTTIQIKLEATDGSGHFYVAKKNPRNKPEKMEVNKYNPKTRKHVKYVEKKIK